MSLLSRLIILIITVLLVHGCAAPLLVAGGAAGATLANDRRTPTAFMNDQKLELRIHDTLASDSSLADDSHLSVTSFDGVVLLTGQVLHQAQFDRIVALMKNENGIKRLHNEVHVTQPTSMETRSQDTWLTTRVKTAMLQHKTLNALQIKVITENSIVYLMGMVTHAEARAAATTAQSVKGVKSIITVFEYLD
jgi:osmotically-inducible protein OsmY